MANLFFCELPHRTLLRISGAESMTFLQNTISNDIAKARGTDTLYALLLTPQGKFLFDFFITRHAESAADSFLFDCEKAVFDDLVKKLTLYRLRADVVFTPLPEIKTWFIWGNETPTLPCLFVDPRRSAFGWRYFSKTPPPNMTRAPIEQYHHRRVALGIPEAGIELTQDRLPLECNLDMLNAIDFHKGCYIGQEVTSRMKRRADGGRKRMALVEGTRALPQSGQLFSDDRAVGHMLSIYDRQGLALIRQDRLRHKTAHLGAEKVQLHFLFEGG